MNSTLVSRARPRALLAFVLFAVLCVAARPARAQERYDDHEVTDRGDITLGGYTQDDLRTTIRIDAKSPVGGIAAPISATGQNLMGDAQRKNSFGSRRRRDPFIGSRPAHRHFRFDLHKLAAMRATPLAAVAEAQAVVYG